MTQQVNTTYARALRKPAMRMVYLVIFSGVPTRFSTGPITAPLGPTLPIIRNLTSSMAQVTLDEGRSSLAGTTVDILDTTGFITNMAFEYQLGNRQVTVMRGFQGMPESKFATVFTGRVNNYTLQPDNVTWTFQLVSMMTDLFPNIFDQTCYVAVPVLAGDAVINVDTTVGWPTSSGTVQYLLIGQEVISYTGVTGTSFTGCVRGALGTTAAAHSTNDVCNGFYVLQDNPMNLALQIMTSTGLGTNGPYDVLPANAGLAIPVALVDVAAFQSAANLWLSNWVFRFEEFRSVVGKQFLEQQIYTFCNAYPVLNAQGQLSIKIYTPPLPSQLAQSLDDLQMAAPPTFSGNVFSTYFYTLVDFSHDYNFLQDLTNANTNSSTGPYNARTFYSNPAAASIFGTDTTKVWQSRGLRSSIIGQPKIDHVAQRFLKRFSIPSPLLTLKTLMGASLIEQADIVPVTSAKVPNLNTGKIGITNQLMEVLGVQPNYLEGTQNLLVAATGYSYGHRYAAISPSAKAPGNFPTYDLATPAQMLYAFICTKVNATSGIMADGSSGYYIT